MGGGRGSGKGYRRAGWLGAGQPSSGLLAEPPGARGREAPQRWQFPPGRGSQASPEPQVSAVHPQGHSGPRPPSSRPCHVWPPSPSPFSPLLFVASAVRALHLELILGTPEVQLTPRLASRSLGRGASWRLRSLAFVRRPHQPRRGRLAQPRGSPLPAPHSPAPPDTLPPRRGSAPRPPASPHSLAHTLAHLQARTRLCLTGTSSAPPPARVRPSLLLSLSLAPHTPCPPAAPPPPRTTPPQHGLPQPWSRGFAPHLATPRPRAPGVTGGPPGHAPAPPPRPGPAPVPPTQSRPRLRLRPPLAASRRPHCHAHPTQVPAPASMGRLALLHCGGRGRTRPTLAAF